MVMVLVQLWPLGGYSGSELLLILVVAKRHQDAGSAPAGERAAEPLPRSAEISLASFLIANFPGEAPSLP